MIQNMWCKTRSVSGIRRIHYVLKKKQILKITYGTIWHTEVNYYDSIGLIYSNYIAIYVK